VNKSDGDLTASERKNLPRDAKHLIANARNDITIPFFSGALQYVDDTLIQKGGGRGLKIYDELERDTHAFAMLQKRKKTLVAREWVVETASDDPQDVRAAEIVKALLKALPFDRICEDFLDATLKGFAVSEIIWGRREGLIVPEKIVAHDQRRFVFDEDWNPRLLTYTDMRDGIELPGRKFVVHRHGVKGNNPYGLGLGTRLFWPVLFKREGVAFWLHFLEKFAGPTVVAEIPFGVLAEEQRKLMLSLNQIRTSSAVTVPVGTDVKFLEAARSGSVTYQEFLNYWDKQMSICVNGETLTTDIGSNGSKAASQTHENMLENLVDSDGDLLSDTLKQQLLTWIVDYNVPGARVPDIWRVRAENEVETAKVRKSKAEAAIAVDKALMTVVRTARQFDSDDDAREYITSHGLTEGLSDQTIDQLVAMRAWIKEPEVPSFAAGRKRKKKLHDHACFANPDSPTVQLTDQLLTVTEGHFARRIGAIRKAVDAPSAEDASANLLKLWSGWSPKSFSRMIDQAHELSALQGREAVFNEADAVDEFAAEVVSQPFQEQIDFLLQKRAKPTKVWTDAMRGDHDRAFVVAGATDLAMVEEFHEAILDAAENWDQRAFAKDFDRIVEKYGWAYNGGRNWRIRTIFAANMRTSYMAGRLQQMRDPDVLRLRPFWEYRHAEIRVPRTPRELHKSWDGLVLRHDDPWWDYHFPPNDWLCSCGVASLSLGDMKRMGKTGPDKAPEIVFESYTHQASGETVQKPKGVGYGWDYQPGNLWERGLVPSQLIDEAGGPTEFGRHVATVDVPEPMDDLVAKSRPFKSEPMAEGLTDAEYIDGFLSPFGAKQGEAVLFEDKAGDRIPISDQYFRDARGEMKITKRNRAMMTPLMAETIMDPDEIWVGVVARPDLVDGSREDLVVDRRYIRVDRETGLLVVLQIGRKFWEAVTAYLPTDKKGRPDMRLLDKRRGGKLLWKRKGRQG
jgi:hypothetical protein